MTDPALHTIENLHAAFRSGELTPGELLESCLANIEHREEQIQAWVSVDRAGARQLADEQSRQLPTMHRRDTLPLLFGIPIGIKDIIDVAGWPTRAGSPLRANRVAPADAPLVARLRLAGAIVLGKTVTTQFACFDPAATHNPWRSDRTPGGSSSGSAAAVATGMCLAAIGTQTGGSIIRPASYCGVVGFKPSYGSIAMQGIVPVAESLDHAGPLTRSVDDAARLFQVMSGASGAVHSSQSNDAPVRFGIVRDFFCDQAAAETQAIFEAVLVHLENEVGSVEEVQLPVDIAQAHYAYRTIMAAQCAAYHRAEFTLNRESYGPNISQLIEAGLTISAVDLAAAFHAQLRFREAALKAFARFDVLAMPATHGAAPSIETTGDPRWQSPWSLAGLPAITLACGFAALHLPLGLQLVAANDDGLLHIAAQCETAIDLQADLARMMAE